MTEITLGHTFCEQILSKRAVILQVTPEHVRYLLILVYVHEHLRRMRKLHNVFLEIRENNWQLYNAFLHIQDQVYHFYNVFLNTNCMDTQF